MARLIESAALPCPIVTTTATVAGHHYELRRPESSEALFSEENFAVDERLPYWADIWPSSRVLAERLATMQGHGLRLLELGCGVGLVALCAARAGFSVLASDYYAESVEFTAANAQRNGFPGIEVRVIDWRQYPDDLGRFDIVLASDVLYERPNPTLVAEALARSLSAEGYALVSDPGRRVAELFPEACAAAGLQITRVEHVPFIGVQTPLTIRIYEVRRSPDSD
jgi:2-polyprenyl-3-methyl-5-hydroxy-6-metoxy-1,4-benzoquinol methylase